MADGAGADGPNAQGPVNRGVRFEVEAALELAEAALWYHQRRAGLGAEFMESIDAALELVRQWPEAAPRASGVAEVLNIRRAPVPRFPYGIIYAASSHDIQVLAIAHNSRESDYWIRGMR